jgi:hypothetical protein
MGFMIFEKEKKSVSKDDVVAVVESGVNVFIFHLRGGHIIQVNEVNEDENKKIKAAFFDKPKAGTW